MGMMPLGLTPEEDQALAGLIMWVPGGLVHAGAAILLLGRISFARPAPAMTERAGAGCAKPCQGSHRIRRGTDFGHPIRATAKSSRCRLTANERPRRGARLPRAQMAELVDAPASGAGARKGVEVRVLFWAPALLKSLKTLGNRPLDGLLRVLATVACYRMGSDYPPQTRRKPSQTRRTTATVTCYGICPRECSGGGIDFTIATSSPLALSPY